MATTSSSTSMAIPGQFLGPTSKFQAGPGTHIHESNLYASLLGAVNITQPAKAPGPAKRLNKIINTQTPPSELPTISVLRTAGSSDKREVLPEVGNIVLCRVIRIMPRQAVVAILICGDTVLEAEWQGLIRVQDVRATEKDRVKIYDSFRPGDIVRAEVVSALLFLRIPKKDWTLLLTCCHFIRFLLVTKRATTYRQRATSSVSLWRQARLATPCTPSTGRNTRTPRLGSANPERLRSPTEVGAQRMTRHEKRCFKEQMHSGVNWLEVQRVIEMIRMPSCLGGPPGDESRYPVSNQLKCAHGATGQPPNITVS